MQNGAIFHEDGAAESGFAFDVGMGGESAGPRDIAVAGRIKHIAAFAEDPAGAGVLFTQGKVISGDVLLVARETFLDRGELIHEGKAEIMFLSGEVDLAKDTAEARGG